MTKKRNYYVLTVVLFKDFNVSCANRVYKSFEKAKKILDSLDLDGTKEYEKFKLTKSNDNVKLFDDGEGNYMFILLKETTIN